MLRIAPLCFIALASACSKAPEEFTPKPVVEQHDTIGSQRPNVLLIVTDQQNRQALGCMGERKVVTPALDRLASEGALFRWGYCNDPICSPSRYSMLSGLYPTEIGAFENHIPPREDVPLLSHYLGRAGYATAALGKADFADPDNAHGFDEVYLHYGYLGSGGSNWFPWYAERATERGLELVHYRKGEESDDPSSLEDLCPTHSIPDDLTPEAWITEKSLLQMKRAQEAGKPFFINANYFPPHHPYGPVAKYLELYERADIDLPSNFEPPADLPMGIKSVLYESWSEADWRKVLHHYYTFVSQVDHHIGALLDGMEALGLADDTLVFFVSDHGDMAGEFRSLTKGQPFEGSLGVPFLVRWPRRFSGGRSLDAPVSLIDIAPTILEAVGEPVPADLRGRSLLGLIEGRQDPAEREVYAIDVRKDPFLLIALREPRWKLSAMGRSNGRHEFRLVDMIADPHELIDRWQDPEVRDVRRRMQDKLLAFWDRESQFVPRPLPKPLPLKSTKLPNKD